MRVAYRRIIGGVLTYALGFVLTGLVAYPWLDQILRGAPGSSSGPYHVYRIANEPLLTAVGWILLSVHRAEMVVRQPGMVGHLNPVQQAGFGWLLVVPAIACFIGGLVTGLTSSRSTPNSVFVGMYQAIGYVFAMTVSFFLLRLRVIDSGTSIMASPDILSILWLFPAIALPLIFGSLGAFLSRSPIVAAAIPRTHQ